MVATRRSSAAAAPAKAEPMVRSNPPRALAPSFRANPKPDLAQAPRLGGTDLLEHHRVQSEIWAPRHRAARSPSSRTTSRLGVLSVRPDALVFSSISRVAASSVVGVPACRWEKKSPPVAGRPRASRVFSTSPPRLVRPG